MSNPEHLYAIKRPDGILILTTDDDKEATWRRASVIDRVLADLAWSEGVGSKFSHKAIGLGYRCVEVELVEKKP